MPYPLRTPLVALLALLLAALPLASGAWAAPGRGASLETPTGERLFPPLFGEPLPGWLADFDAPAMRIAYPGPNERRALGGGATLALVRAGDLVAGYLLEGGHCVGEARFEPRRAPAPSGWLGGESAEAALETRWRQEGFRASRGFLATRDRAYALDVLRFVRRHGGMVEKRWLVAWPAPDAPAPPGALGAALPTRWGPAGEARYPAAFVPAMRALEQEGESGLAERARSERDH